MLSFAAIDRESGPRPELDLIELVPMFTPLSIAAKESVAASLEQWVVQPGEIVIHAGDAGDRFYVVGDGQLDVDAGGLHVTLGRGDHFGEIALLRNVPRTATVTAVAKSELYGLSREDFLATVTGHHVVRAIGEDIAATRLGQSDRPSGTRLRA
jgi:CRP-like cAMP-binding protein